MSAGLDLGSATTTSLDGAVSPLFSALQTKWTQSEKDLKPVFLLLVHNAGSLGCIDLPADQLTDLSHMETYYKANLSSLICLTSCFMKRLSILSSTHMGSKFLCHDQTDLIHS
ncbi:unnamed protein product [Protopolystoma xenopodis]|uniref:Uncharacterized protein n=1 Tax=Protopolystoma xenopodis TaxID=117903 RepID=A0A3S5BFZ1_9PLAT|nr:unnamed protein product [Protopolystoma xenopodis]